MCGIAGVIDFNKQVSEEEVRSMCNTMVRRGPDGEGVFIDQGIGLGHRRLSIVDLTAEANQPMHDYSERYVVVFNGEIYGYKLLRHELLGSGAKFRTQSDTEIILEGYKCWGFEELCKRLKGMFALAIWDRELRILSIARDRFGEKPLFIRRHAGRISFASNTHSLFLNDVPELNRSAIYSYLKDGYCLPEFPLISGVTELLPGTGLQITRTGERMITFHKPEFHTVSGRTDEEWLHDLDLCLSEVTGLELVADVPVGSLISGGVDSALVSYYASKKSSIDLFTVRMGGGIDESAIASRIARHLDAKHTIVDCSFPGTDQVTNFLGEFSLPLGDSSALGMWMVAREAAKYTRVVLTGDGGDEFFAGYDSVKLNLALKNARKYLDNTLIRKIYQKLVKQQYLYTYPFSRKILSLLNMASQSAGSYHVGRSHIPFEFMEQMEDLTGFYTKYKEVYLAKLHSFAADSEIDQIMGFDILTTLPADYTPKVDVSSMTHSVECRSPFLHPDITELSYAMPLAVKRMGDTSKGILKKLLVNKLGENVARASITGKRGFVLPVNQWMNSCLDELEMMVNNSEIIRKGYLSRKQTRALFSRYRADQYRYGRLLFSWISLSFWSNSHLKTS